MKYSIDILVIGHVRLTPTVAGKLLPSAILNYTRAYFQGRRVSEPRNQHDAVTAFSETSTYFQRIIDLYSVENKQFNSFVAKN
jgi:hypothetical protein